MTPSDTAAGMPGICRVAVWLIRHLDPPSIVPDLYERLRVLEAHIRTILRCAGGRNNPISLVFAVC